MHDQDGPVSNIAVVDPYVIVNQPGVMPFGWMETDGNQAPIEEPQDDSNSEDLSPNDNDEGIPINDEDIPEVVDPCTGVTRVLDGDIETKTYWAAPKDDPTKCRFEIKISDEPNESLMFIYSRLEGIMVDSFPDNVNTLFLYHNNLTSFPELKLHQIKTLSLNENQITSLKDIVIPSGLETLYLEWNPINDIEGVEFPESLTYLTLSIDQLSSLDALDIPNLQKLRTIGVPKDSFKAMPFPDVVDLDLWNIRGASLGDIQVGPSLSSFTLSGVYKSKFEGLSLPSTLKDFHIMDSDLTKYPEELIPDSVVSINIEATKITELYNITLPSQLGYLRLDLNNIKRIVGVDFPSTLTSLSLLHNPIKEFEIPARNEKLFRRLQIKWVPSFKQTCSNSLASTQSIGGTKFCILPDKEFDRLYPRRQLADLSLSSPTPARTKSKTPIPSASPVPEQNTTTSHQDTVIRIGGLALFDFIGIICGVVACLMIIGFVVWKYKSRQLNKQDKKKDPLLPSGSAPPVSELRLAVGTEENTAASPPTFPRVGYCPPATVDVLMHPLWQDQNLLDARIPIDDIQFGIRFAKGAFGEVFEGSIKSGRIVAIKRLLPEYRKEMTCVETFLKEAKILLSTKHPNIVQMLGVAWSTPSDFCVVCELMSGGDLKTRLMQLDRMNHPVGFNENKLRLAYHIIDALAYLHGIKNPMGPIIHRDLKSKNILLNDRYDTAKLTDFGVSRETTESITMTAAVGTSLWMAPEVLMGKRYDTKADIFSYGIVLTELDTQKGPYFYAKHLAATIKGQSTVADVIIIQQVASGRLTASFSPLVSEEIQALGTACLQLDPSKRPTAAQVRSSLDAILNKPRSTSVTL